MENLSDDIMKGYLRLTRIMGERLRQHYGKMNLTMPQLMVLSTIDANGPMQISQLADSVGSANSTVSGIVDRLEAMDLVKRTRHPEDHRIVIVSPTDKMATIKENMGGKISDHFSVIFEDVPEEEMEKILYGLELFGNALKASMEKQ